MSDQKIALITGGSRGIGAACAKALAADGFAIALHFRRDPERAKAMCAEFPKAHPFQYDLCEEGACENLIKEVKNTCGRIDVLVNNAGRSVDQMITFAKVADFDSLVATNLRPVFSLTKAASKLMIKQKSGSIVNITSVVGHSGNLGQAMYAATKSAITGLSQSVAMDLAGFGIRCNCVAPGFVQTEMTESLDDKVKDSILASIPLKRMGTADEVASAVRFLASTDASYITGSTVHVNGGMYRS